MIFIPIIYFKKHITLFKVLLAMFFSDNSFYFCATFRVYVRDFENTFL